MSGIASIALAVLGLVAFHQYQQGTLGTWLRSKFLNAGDPLPKRDGERDGYPTSGDPLGPDPGTDGVWRKPIDAEPGSGFGPRTDPITGGTRVHAGQDYGAPTGTPVYASRPGTVAYSGARGGYGHLVTLDHGGGWTSRYAHLSERRVSVGDTVRAGQVIGLVGSTGRSTGPHLHFEIRKGGDPVDPAKYLPGGARRPSGVVR